jgi:hypothetical protein
MSAQSLGSDVARSQFVPASKLDFSRYAKNLAWLIGRPQQECQEILARIYGYADLHELQQQLDKGLEPGPYWDEGAEDQWRDDQPEGESPYEGKPILPSCFSGQRSSRAVDVLLRWKKSKGRREWLEGNEGLITDLGLTDSPASHRDCVRRMKLYLEGVKSIDQHGWPTGFWSFCATFDDSELGAFSSRADRQTFGVGDIDEFPLRPRDVHACRKLDLAVDVFNELSPGVEESSKLDYWHEWGSPWNTFWRNLSQWSEDGDMPWEIECEISVVGGVQLLDEETDLRDFIRWPCTKHYNACGLKMPYEAAVEKVRTWRHAWVSEAAKSWRSSRKMLFSIAAYDHDAKTRVARPDLGAVQLLARHEESYDWSEVSFRRVAACFSARGADGQDALLGSLNGWLFSPCENGSYIEGGDLEDVLDENDEMIGDGWSLVQRYMAIRGIEDMGDWVNSGEGSAMLVARMRMAPGQSSPDSVVRFCDLLCKACSEELAGCGLISDNAYWKSSMPGERQPGFEEEPDDTSFINGPGIMVLEIPGLDETGFLIGNEEGEGSQIVVVGKPKRGRRARARWFRDATSRSVDEAANDERSRARAILERLGHRRVDIVITGSLSDPFGNDGARGEGDEDC